MGLLKDMILRSMNEKRQDRKLAEQRQYNEQQKQDNRAYQEDVYQSRRYERILDAEQQRDEQRQFNARQLKQRRLERQQEIKQQRAEAKYQRSAKRKIEILKKHRPNLYNRVLSEGGNVEDYVMSKNPNEYLKGLMPNASDKQIKAWKAGKTLEPSKKPAASMEPSQQKLDPQAKPDTQAQQQEPDATGVASDEVPKPPEQLSQFKDPDSPSAGPPQGFQDPDSPSVARGSSVDDQQQQVQGQTTEPQPPMQAQPDTLAQAASPPSTDAPVARGSSVAEATPQQVAPSGPPSSPVAANSRSPISGLSGLLVNAVPGMRGIHHAVNRLLPERVRQGDQALGEGLAQGVAKAGMGAVQGAAAGLTAVSILGEETYNKMTKGMESLQKNMFDATMQRNPKADPTAVRGAVLAGEVLPWLAAGPSLAGGLGMAAAKGAGLGATMGASQFQPSGADSNRTFTTLTGAVLGGAAGAVTSLASKLTNAFTKKGAQLTMSKAVNQAKKLGQGGDDALEAGQRLGVQTDAAAATQSPSVMREARKVHYLKPKAVDKLTEKVVRDEQKLTDETYRMVDGMLKGKNPQAIKTQTDALLGKVMDTQVPRKVYGRLVKNPTIVNHMKQIAKDPDVMAVAGDQKSYRFFKTVADKLSNDASALSQAGNKGPKFTALTRAAKTIRSALGGSNKYYRQGMELAQRSAVHEKWTGELAKISKTIGGEKPNLRQIHQKLFAKDEVFNELVADLNALGIKPQAANDLRTIMNRMATSPVGKLVSKINIDSLVSGMSVSQGPQGMLGRTAHAIFKRRYDEEIIRLITSGHRSQELANIAKIKNTPRMIDRFAKLLTVTGTKGVSEIYRPNRSEPVPGGPGGPADGLPDDLPRRRRR